MDKQQRAEYYRRWYAEHRGHVIEDARRRKAERAGLLRWLKEGPCTDCGRQLPPWAMSFDHLNPTEKVAAVSKMLTHSLSRFVAEILKTDLVCTPCHQTRTRARKNGNVVWNKPPE